MMRQKYSGLLIVCLLLPLFAQDKASPVQPLPVNPVSSQQKAQSFKDKIPVSDTIKIPVLDFKNTDIRDVLRAVGMQYTVNIYVEPEVKGEVSLYLTNVTVRDAIDFIVKRKGYDYIVENGIVKVFKPEQPLPPPPPVAKIVFHVQDSLLTADFRDIPVDDVVRMAIDSAHVNVVLDGQSNKKISGKMNAIKVEKAIRILFETNGFAVRISDNICYVTPQAWGDDANKGTGAQHPQRTNLTVTKDRKVSLEVTNAALDDIVRTIATESGINIIVYDKISGTISAKCDSTYIDDILRFLLQNTNYTFWKDKDVYFIGSREMSQQKTTVSIPLKHIRAEESGLSKLFPPAITKDALIKYDSEHNSLIVIGSFDVVAQAQDFIAGIDKPIPQVLLEALVVEFNLSKIRSYGVSIFTSGLKDSSGDWTSEQFLPTVNLKPGRKRIAMFLNQVLRYLGIDRVVELPKNFRVVIQALEAADVVKVHSTPQIATINGNAASITIGETRYYKLSKETISTTQNQNMNVLGKDERFEEKKFNTQLEVTPWVMADGYVMVDIRPEFNIPRGGGDADRPPTVDSRVIKSMVRLRDGQTIVLGGQRQTENMINSKGVPLLSSIPVLGWLFSSKTVTKSETQMMIFLTPHVYYGDEGAVKPDDYFGSEINKMLEKNDPDLRKKKKEEERSLRKQKREERKKHWELRRQQRKQVEESERLKQKETENDTAVLKKEKKSFLWSQRSHGNENSDTADAVQKTITTDVAGKSNLSNTQRADIKAVQKDTLVKKGNKDKVRPVPLAADSVKVRPKVDSTKVQK